LEGVGSFKPFDPAPPSTKGGYNEAGGIKEKKLNRRVNSFRWGIHLILVLGNFSGDDLQKGNASAQSDKIILPSDVKFQLH